MAHAVTVYIIVVSYMYMYVDGAHNKFMMSAFRKTCNYIITPSLPLTLNALHSSSLVKVFCDWYIMFQPLNPLNKSSLINHVMLNVVYMYLLYTCM